MSIKYNYLTFFFALITVFSFFNVVYSFYLNLYLNLNTYYISLFISLILGFLSYYNNTIDKKFNIFEKILTVFIGYIILPFVLSLPFYFSI